MSRALSNPTLTISSSTTTPRFCIDFLPYRGFLHYKRILHYRSFSINNSPNGFFINRNFNSLTPIVVNNSHPGLRPLAAYQGNNPRPWEMKEEEEKYEVKFNMPGMTEEDVALSVEAKILVVNAEKKEINGQEKWSDRRYKGRIPLPRNIQIDKIRFKVKNEVLYVIIPKTK